LILKPREVTYEEAEAAEAGPDVATTMANTIIDLERELKTLRKRVSSEDVKGKVGEEALDRLRYIQEELQAILGESFGPQ
jgi:hypothetical protein